MKLNTSGQFSRQMGAVAMVVMLTGCAAWTPAQLVPSSLDGAPREVRITLMNGDRFPVSEPRMTPDSLFGVMVGLPYEAVALPLAWVRSIDLPRQDTHTAVALGVIGGVAAFFLAMLLIFGVGAGT
jgi:hypothetical protein